MILQEELCKREYSAMLIKTMKPDPVDFKSTVKSWIENIFREHKAWVETFDINLWCMPSKTFPELFENRDNWQDSLSDETFVTIIIERLRTHIPTLMTTYDIDKDNVHPWTVDTLKAFLQRMNKDNWESAVTFRPFEATSTLSQRFTPHAPQMKCPEYRIPLVTRVMQHFKGIDDTLNIHTTWDRKVEKLQKDEQEARIYLQTIASRYPGRLQSFMALITRMEEATHDVGNDIFIIATDTVNDIITQVRQLIGPKYERQNVLDKERIETDL